MIELDGIGYAWPDAAPVLRDLSLRVEPGDKLVLLGANGAGKSTLLKLLNGLVFADRGHYRFDGDEVSRTAFRNADWSRAFRQRNVLLFQHPEAMLFNPTVREEIAYGPRQLGLGGVEARVRRWSEQLDLGPVLDLPPWQLSGGGKQKVALAALLALEPGVLLLDEPVANLDPRSSGWLIDYLIDTPATVIVSTHNLSMAAELGTRCAILDPNGGLCHDGTVHTALEDIELLERANLVHRHRHRHGGVTHSHAHIHDWD